MKTFDEKDQSILDQRMKSWDERKGPRVGDWVIMANGEYRRFTHEWPDGLQVGDHPGDCGSFYLGKGHVSYSGGLDRLISTESLELTTEMKDGRFWFFHHHNVEAHNGVWFSAPCRVWRVKK